MNHPKIQFLVTRQDESAERGFCGTHIPTLGHAATAFDSYRTVGVHSVSEAPDSWCITDTDAAASLGRVIDGPISSAGDIEKAESALRTILLHDYIEILVPCVKGEQSNGFVHYVRLDGGQRNDATFAAFQTATCRDLLFATEYVKFSNGLVSESNNTGSYIVGKSQEELHLAYGSFLKTVSEVASAYPMAIGAATYYTAADLVAPMNRGPAGFIDEMYRRVSRPWMEVAQVGPPLHVDIKLPPLLAIVLSRASSRSKIPETLRQLRAELSPARQELNKLNLMLDGTLTQADIHSRVRKANESFDAIVPEALLTDSERLSRRWASVFRFLKPVRQLYSIAVDPVGASSEQFLDMFTTTREAVAANSRIVSRSVTATTLAELLRVDSVRETVLTHFSGSEVDLIRAGSA